MSVLFKTHRDKTQFANAILQNCDSKLRVSRSGATVPSRPSYGIH